MIVTFAVSIGASSYANEKQYIPVDSNKTVRINYGYPPWNRNSKEIDSAFIIMREGKTGRLVQINVEETAPDSSLFSGVYSLNWQNLNSLSPEFYIPSAEIINSPKAMDQIAELIKSGRLQRKAFILRRLKNAPQTIEIYDTKEQAKLALKAFRAEQELTDMQNKPYIDRSAIDAGVLAEQLAERKRAAEALLERVRLIQLESARAAERVKAFALLSDKEKQKHREQAQKLAQSGLQNFYNQKNLDAQGEFEKAIELDPNNKLYYFQYGVVLYKNENFVLSMVMMDMAADAPPTIVNEVELHYYMGLNFYRLKIYTESIQSFTQVVEAKNPGLSGSAQFYIGVCLFEQSKFTEAQASFQKVLDSGQDPKLDARAEQYIEQILRIQQFEAERAKRWTLSATLGLSFDSNILQTSDTILAGTPTNTSGERLLTVASAKYRALYETDRELSAQLDLTNMYSVDSAYQYNQSIRDTDPLLMDLTLPYTIKGTYFGKGFKLDLVPGFELLSMSADQHTQKFITNSFLGKALSTFVMSESWFASFNLELKKDNSNLSTSTGNDDQSAINVKLSTSQILLLNKEKNKIAILDGALAHNNANGMNYIYDRFDLGAAYVAPAFWDLMYNAKLSYFLLNYPSNSNGRTDNSYTLTGGLSKKINNSMTAGVTGTYNINNSNVDTYTYKKWTAMMTLSMSFGL